MKFWSKQKIFSWLPQLDYQVWILAVGRLLSQIGTGFTLFYLPIFFVNQVGLSATAVGIGLGSASVSGVLGRILGGSMSDSRSWGRKPTLLLSAAVSAIASLFLAAAYNFPSFVIGNLIMGFGVGLYWPSTEAVVADLSRSEDRNEAYALTRLADNIGLGLGVVLGGTLIAISGAYRALFVIDAISFAIFFVVVCWKIRETSELISADQQQSNGWAIALQDRKLMIYVLVNVLITSYLAQVNSTMPLYFKNFVRHGEGFDSITISVLFTWYLGLSICCQLPVARFLNRYSRPQALVISSLLWAMGFVLIWVTGVTPANSLVWAILGLAVLAIATVAYTPAASSLVADLAPESLRGVYLSINSLCWAVGYFIGPPLGGFALDQTRLLANTFWLGLALSVGIAILILQYLNRILLDSHHSNYE